MFCCRLPPVTLLQLLTEASGFVTIVCGTFLLHTTKDVDLPAATFVQLITRGGAAGGGGASSGQAGGGGSSSRLLSSAVGGGGGAAVGEDGAGELELGSGGTPKAAQRRGGGTAVR